MDLKKLTEIGRLRRSVGNFLKSAEGKSSNRSKDENMDSFQVIEKMERETGIEPATSSLGSWHSTAELLPRYYLYKYK